MELLFQKLKERQLPNGYQISILRINPIFWENQTKLRATKVILEIINKPETKLSGTQISFAFYPDEDIEAQLQELDYYIIEDFTFFVE